MSTKITIETKARLAPPDADLIPALKAAFSFILENNPPKLTTDELAEVLAYSMASCLANCIEEVADDAKSYPVRFN
jgi:hypothetical protein